MEPLSICAAPTAGKIVLCSLLEGNPEIFSTPLWHDNVSAALVNPTYIPPLDKDFCNKFWGNDLRLLYLKRFLYNNTEYSKLEAISNQGFYIYYLSSEKMIRVSIDLNFYEMDCNISKKIFNSENYDAKSIFSTVFCSLKDELLTKKNTTKENYHQKISEKYAVTMPFNDFSDYDGLIKTFPNGKIIYIDRDLSSAIGSCLIREAKLSGCSFEEVCKNYFKNNRNIVRDYIFRLEKLRHLQTVLKDKVYIVKFSDIILNTSIAMKNICNWLDVPFSEKMTLATFLGNEIDGMAIGKINDNIDELLTQKNKDLLTSLIDECRYNIEVRKTKSIKKLKDMIVKKIFTSRLFINL